MGKVSRVIRGRNKQATFALTTECNCRCITCGIWKDHKSIPYERAMQLLKSLYDNKFGFIGFTGGEPVLYPQLCDLIKYTTDHDMFAFIPTNGTTINAEYAKKLKDVNVSMVSVSIDHYDEKICEKVRNHKNVLNKAKRTIEHLKRNNIPTASATTITRYNYKDMDSIIEFVNNELGMPFAFCYPITETAFFPLGGDKNAVTFTNNELYKTISQIRSLKKKGSDILTSYAYIDEVLRFLNNKPTKHPCSAGKDVIYIDWNGDVFPCFQKEKICNYTNFKLNEKSTYCNECMAQCFREASIFTASFRGKFALAKEWKTIMKTLRGV